MGGFFGIITLKSSLATPPAGSTTQVQYNNGGVFGANAGFTYDGTAAVNIGNPSGTLKANNALSSTGAGGTLTLNSGNGGSTSGAGGGIAITGGSPTDGDGGSINITSGSGATVTSANRRAGNFNFNAGAATGTRSGGAINATAGQGGATGLGGTVSFIGGPGGATSGNGGAVTLQGGRSTTSGNGGAVTLATGTGAGAGVAGNLLMQIGAATAITINPNAVNYSFPLVLSNYLVAGLPSAATIGSGGRAFVTDSTVGISAGLGLTVIGGGANKVPVYSDGANWIIG